MLVYGTEEEIARAYGEKIIYENQFYKKKYVKNKQRRTIQMTKEEMIKKIEGSKEVLEELLKNLTLPEHGGKRWRPAMDQRYFYTGSLGEIFNTIWDDGLEVDDMYAIGNAFPSYEAAEFELERRKVIAELSDFAEDNDIVWDRYKGRHWYIEYDLITNTVTISFCLAHKYACLYFPSEEAARAAIKAVGEERVKKYYLGVNDDKPRKRG